MSVRSAPCGACPYRCDVPPGVWHHDEYDKLRLYDEVTAYQPPEAFSCHATPDGLCHGWAVVHSNRGHEFELLALRLKPTPVPAPIVALFGSGNDAADHGQSTPNAAAEDVASRLLRKYPRLST